MIRELKRVKGFESHRSHATLAGMAFCAFQALLVPGCSAAQVVRLNAANWDRYAPAGKEVDAIYGDYVLRNGRITVVVANPTAGRHANLTTSECGGCVIDMTTRKNPSDQLTGFFPLNHRYRFRSASVKNSSGSVTLMCRNASDPSHPSVEVRYTLEDGADWMLVETLIANTTGQQVEIDPVDEVRADHSFTAGSTPGGELWRAYDKWWGQAYGVVPEKLSVEQVKGPGSRGYRLRYTRANSKPGKIVLAPSERVSIARRLVCGRDALTIRDAANRINSPNTRPRSFTLNLTDEHGPVAGADVEVLVAGTPYGSARTASDGALVFDALREHTQVKVQAMGRPEASFAIEPGALRKKTLTLEPPGHVDAHITDEAGGPIPCKVQFIGRDGTADPFFFPDSGEHTVQNCYYSHDGKFEQALPPGKYRVIVSHGPEYDAVMTSIEVDRGSRAPLAARLVRSVDTRGWVSTDFHGHSSPSGDNTASQLGRVLNLLCEHIEYAPCTEHNRLDSYSPHLRALGVEHLMGTAVGIELTGTPLPLNHQNAFPLILKLHTQGNGGPWTDPDPARQIERLALWDNRSDKLVQQNHPNILQMFWDKDLDGKPDQAHRAMLPYMDVIEIHPPQTILQPAAIKNGINTGENCIHAWLQLLNQGIRVPGAVNTDAHYNFHGSGWLRNFVKSPTDDPAKIQTMDIVHEAQKGHIVVSTGPFMEVTATSGGAAFGPGDEMRASSGQVSLRIKVQCPNWLNIDRVQILRNGRADPNLNFTRHSNPEQFGDRVVKFDQTLPVSLDTDTHLIVVAIGEQSTLGDVMGPQLGPMHPVAVSNPIYVDVDGGGFKPNGDTLDAPLPR